MIRRYPFVIFYLLMLCRPLWSQPNFHWPLAARIGAIDDVQRLKQLFRAAIQVPSLEAFRHLLDEAE